MNTWKDHITGCSELHVSREQCFVCTRFMSATYRLTSWSWISKLDWIELNSELDITMGRFSNQVLCRLYQRRELRILTPCAYLQIWICQKICMNQNPNSFGIVFTTKLINLRRFIVTILNSLHCNLRPPSFPPCSGMSAVWTWASCPWCCCPRPGWPSTQGCSSVAQPLTTALSGSLSSLCHFEQMVEWQEISVDQ